MKQNKPRKKQATESESESGMECGRENDREIITNRGNKANERANRIRCERKCD